MKDVLRWFILLLIALIAFLSRLFSVLRFESIIHEYDPWFNYRSSKFLIEHGFDQFLNWFDPFAWYPLGRFVGGTVYPGLMISSASIHWLCHQLHWTIDIREICVFLAPIFSSFTALITYLFTKELWSDRAGLFAAAFIAIAPGYASRSVAGSYDNEGIGIFAMIFTYFLWIRSMKSGSLFFSSCTALTYFYMVSAWGGYVFIINLIAIHVLILLIFRRYSLRLYVSYSTFFVLGLMLSMQIPFVAFQPVRTSEHLIPLGTFLLLQGFAIITCLQEKIHRNERVRLVVSFLFIIGLLFGGILWRYAKHIAPWSGRFYALWNLNDAQIHSPIISSVAEHQPALWSSFLLDLHCLIALFPAGLWFCFKSLNDERIFLILYALFASYFASAMIRLMLILTPCVCVSAAIALSKTIDSYMELDVSDDDPSASIQTEGKTSSSSSSVPPIITLMTKCTIIFCLIGMLILFALHCTWTISTLYSSPSIILTTDFPNGSRLILDDFREGYSWLRHNTAEDARIVSWWDYGYQILGMANRTVLIDNNTWNNTQIALVGKALASNESKAYRLLKRFDADYVLVICGALIGYVGDDIDKLLWMIRIAQGEYPDEIEEKNYLVGDELRLDRSAPSTLFDSLLYQLCYYRFAELEQDPSFASGYDHARDVEIGRKIIELEHFEEIYTSEHWLVRIYRVKNEKNRH